MTRSGKPGKSTSGVDLSNVSAHGMWLLVGGREHYLPFDQFPWFRDATIAQLARIERPAPSHLRWPDLDVDLSLESIDYPERYPLVSRVSSEVRESPEPPDD